ncbi:MAG TPA: response regulator [Polyangia bacterium]|jgi:DNA-binding response OmpR family regulator
MPAPAPPVPALRLLIVDDAAAVGRALARVARGLGWAADAVTSWEQAQRLLGATPYHLLLVDFGLGERFTGADAIAWVRRAYPALSPVLMSCGDAGAAAAAAVACPVLLKPFRPDQFAALLDAVAAATAGAGHGTIEQPAELRPFPRKETTS